MEKLRRGTTRFNKQSSRRNKLFSSSEFQGAAVGGGGGDFVQLSAKSKKERLRKLSALGGAAAASSRRSFPVQQQHCEMGCDVSDRDDDELTSKRFKLPKKFFDDCNGVDHAPVPRKLRSAMKKRTRESASPSLPSLKKLNHTISGIESPKRHGVNKSEPNLKQGGSERTLRETVSGDITKDEEEVVETLYALAGLFWNNDPNDNSQLETEPLDTKPSALPESKESPTLALEVGKDKLSSICSLRASEAASPSCVKRLAQETDQVDSLNKPSTQHEPELPDTTKFCISSDNSVPQNLNVSSLSAKVEECNEKPTGNAANFCVPSDLSLYNCGLNQPVQKESSVLGRKPETALELSTAIGSQVKVHDMVQELKKNGPVLWPGLSSSVSNGARNGSPSTSSSSQSPAAKIPAWMDAAAALSTSRVSVQNGSSFGKITNVLNGRRPYKKCAAHVYISHLIQTLQNSESKDKLQLQPNQVRSHEGYKQGVLMGVNICTKVKNSNGIVSPRSIGISTAEKNPNEAKNGTMHQKLLQQDQPQSAMGSRAYTSPKQSFDFLSLSAGGGGLETNDSFSRARNRMEPTSQSQVPYIHSLMQHQTLAPFSLPQSHYSSSACPNNPSVTQQAQLQPPPYHGSPFCGPQASPRALTKQQPQQQHLQLQQHQQQQQRLWAAHLAAQYRPVGTTAPAVQFSSWQNQRQETTLIPCGKAIMSPSPSMLELVGPKYAPLSQQHHQQLISVTSSFPPGRVKQEDHHLPSLYEEPGGGFRGGSALPLQLLCSERLK